MSTKYTARLRRTRRVRGRIKNLEIARLCIHRSNCHIYAQVIAPDGKKVLTCASTLERELRGKLTCTGNIAAAEEVGKLVAQRALALGVKEVAFDRSGFLYHGRVKALATAAREGGLVF